MSAPPPDPRVASLSPIERRILLQVMAGRRGKEIGPLVGTTYDMVEKHIKAAREKLGGLSRIEAARLVAGAEGIDWVQNLDLKKPDLPAPPPLPPRLPDDQGGPRVIAPRRGFPWPFASAGRETNELSLAQRWGWIMVLAVAFMLLAVGLVTSSGSLLDALAAHFLPAPSVKQ